MSITAAEHRELANKRFAQMSAAEPGSKGYSDAALAAIAHVLAAIELHLSNPAPAPNPKGES